MTKVALYVLARVIFDLAGPAQPLFWGAVLMALRQDPQNAMAMSWKARILLALDRDQEAVQSAEEAIQLDADEPFHWTPKA
jgi:hypothetical protein